MQNYFHKFSIHHHFYLPRSADSHCFSLSQSPSRCFTYRTDLNHVFATTRSSNCQFSMPIEELIFALGNLYLKINLINPLRLLGSWHLTHLLCFNSVLRIYDLRPVPLCTLESLTSTGNLCIFCCPNMSKNVMITYSVSNQYPSTVTLRVLHIESVMI